MFKRGDVVLFARPERCYVIGQPSTERTRITLGLVTSITRDGQIKVFRDLQIDYSAYEPSYVGIRMVHSPERHADQYRLPKDKVDVEGIAEYVRNRPWSHNPEHKGMPFDSVEQARAELRQFKRGVSA